MKLFFSILLSVLLGLAQRTPELTIRPTSNSATGVFGLEDLTGNRITIQAPNAVTSHTLTMPGTLSPGCLTVDGAGVLTWAGCVSLPITDSSDLLRDNVNATARARFELSGVTPGTTRVATWPDANFIMAGTNILQTFTQDQTLAANLLFATDNNRNIGSNLLRAQTVFGYGGDFAAPVAGGGYVKSRKFEFADFGGAPSTAFWDMLANVNLTQSILTIRDNGGLNVLQLQKQFPLSGVVNDAVWWFDQLPDADGSRTLGEPGRRWDAHIRNLTVGSCTGCTAGISNLNGLTAGTQTFVASASGSDFQIISSGTQHNFNLPSASQFARGLVTTGSQTFGGDKTFMGSIFPGAARTYSNGTSGFPWFNVTATRLEVSDPLSGSNIWRIQATASSSNSFSIVDGNGVTAFQLIRFAGFTFSKSYVDMDFEPMPGTSRTLGNPSNRWGQLSTNSIEMPSFGTMNAFVGSGNFYNRTFAGTPSCSGVANGWTGIDTSANRIWICIGGVARYAQLL